MHFFSLIIETQKSCLTALESWSLDHCSQLAMFLFFNTFFVCLFLSMNLTAHWFVFIFSPCNLTASSTVVHFQLQNNFFVLFPHVKITRRFNNKTCQTNVRCHSCGKVTHYLGFCHALFTQVNALQIANLVSGASGVPVWRRTKHVGLGKDRSRGLVCPFPRSKTQTPRWLLHPHKPVLLKQRKGSALWPKNHVEEVNAQFKHRKQATLKITYSRIIWKIEAWVKIVRFWWQYSDAEEL